MPEERPVVRYKNAKVVIIGNSGTGKSSLHLALTEEKPVAPRNIADKHHVRLLARQDSLYDDGHREVYETFLCDMGWCSGYRLIHQLYLHDAAVVLIVLDIRSDSDPEVGVSEWVRVIQRIKSQRSTAIKMFLVITRKDRGGGGSHFSDKIQHLKRKLSFDDVFVTSAREGWGISRLKKAILKAIDWETLPAVHSEALIQEFQKFLSNKWQQGRQFLPEHELYEAFEKLWVTTNCQDENPNAQFEACIRCSEVQGMIRRLSLGHYILLQPELFNIYASGLLDEARNDPDGFGRIDEQRSLDGEFSLAEEFARVKDGALERLLLSSIVQDFQSFKIAFKDGVGQQMNLVFPSQSTEDNPDLPSASQEYYTIHFNGDVMSIYSTLLAHLARTGSFVKKDLWRNAVTYTDDMGNMCGISRHMHSETECTLTIFFEASVDEETRRFFTESAFGHVRFYDEHASKRPVLRCPGCGINFTEYQVQSMRNHGRSDFACLVCGAIVDLPDEDPFAALPDTRHSNRNALREEINRRKKMGDYDAFLCCNDDEEDKQAVVKIYHELEKRGIVVWFEGRDVRPREYDSS